MLAITDHDSVAAINAAYAAIQANNYKVQLVAGVEISTRWHGFEIHIVGLGVDVENEDLRYKLNEQQNQRAGRAQKIAEKLSKKGIDNTFVLAQKHANKGVISRTHFAKALVELGAVSSFDQAFKKYLGRGKGAYVTPAWMDIASAVSLIQAAGGIAVIAHPVRYDLSNKWLRKLVFEFKQAGGDALEVGLTQMNPDQKKFVASLALEHDMYSSLGSDFHSPTRWTELGRGISLTEQCRPVWQHPLWSTYNN